jgi:hypothetical protein
MIATLPREQRQRVESPEFYELIRSHITARFLKFVKEQPPDPG